MDIKMHPSVQRVAEFMQCELPAEELQSVAEALAKVAPVLWGHYGNVPMQPLSLVNLPLLSTDD